MENNGLLDNVISVGAINSTGDRSSFSNYGNGLKVVAPGSSSGDYFYFSGTSASCPYVAGIAALLLSVKPNTKANTIASWIYSSCRKLPAYQYSNSGSNGTWNNETGYGLVDAYEAVVAASPFTLSIPDLICEGETHTFSILGPIERCDSIVWSVYPEGEIISGDGTNAIETYIAETPGFSVPFLAYIYYDEKVVTLKEWSHAGIPETYDIIGADEATEWVYMHVEAIMEGATSYTWELQEGKCGIWAYDNKADLMPYDTNHVIIIVTGYNRCGSWYEWLSFTPSRKPSNWNFRQIDTRSVAIYNS